MQHSKGIGVQVWPHLARDALLWQHLWLNLKQLHCYGLASAPVRGYLKLYIISYFKLLQVAIVLRAVEEETILTFRALDEPIGSQKLLHHARLSDARSCAVGVRSVPIVMEHSWVKTHLSRLGSCNCLDLDVYTVPVDLFMHTVEHTLVTRFWHKF